MQHIEIYTDESGGPLQTIQSVCLIAGLKSELTVLDIELNQFKSHFAIEELKATKIRTTKGPYRCALEWIKILSSYASQGKIHIRAYASDGADQYSLEKRYLQGLHALNSLYSAINPSYTILPDQNNGFPRDTHRQYRSNFLPIKEVRQVKSEQETLIQASDLISGILRYGVEEFTAYTNWQQTTTDSNELHQARFHLLAELQKQTASGHIAWGPQQIGFVI